MLLNNFSSIGRIAPSLSDQTNRWTGMVTWKIIVAVYGCIYAALRTAVGLFLLQHVPASLRMKTDWQEKINVDLKQPVYSIYWPMYVFF